VNKVLRKRGAVNRMARKGVWNKQDNRESVEGAINKIVREGAARKRDGEKSSAQ
jgi:hypothetical protein